MKPPSKAAVGAWLRIVLGAETAIGPGKADLLDNIVATGSIAAAGRRMSMSYRRAWLHIDAAWAGVATVAPEFRWLHDGVDAADSYCTNPHKWLLTNFDCSAFWVADRTALVGALSILPEYLRNAATESGAVIDYRDWQVPLGRKFRALKLWSVIRWYGVAGLQEHVRTHVSLAQDLAAWVAADERFEILAPHPLALVTFRLRQGDEATRDLMERINASGQAYLTHTAVNGQVALRVAIGGVLTERSHVEQLWAQLSAP